MIMSEPDMRFVMTLINAAKEKRLRGLRDRL